MSLIIPETTGLRPKLFNWYNLFFKKLGATYCFLRTGSYVVLEKVLRPTQLVTLNFRTMGKYRKISFHHASILEYSNHAMIWQSNKKWMTRKLSDTALV